MAKKKPRVSSNEKKLMKAISGRMKELKKGAKTEGQKARERLKKWEAKNKKRTGKK